MKKNNNSFIKTEKHNSYINTEKVSPPTPIPTTLTTTTTTERVVVVINYSNRGKANTYSVELKELVYLCDILTNYNKLRIIFFLFHHKISYLNELVKVFNLNSSTISFLLGELLSKNVIKKIDRKDQSCEEIIKQFRIAKHNAPRSQVKFYTLSLEFSNPLIRIFTNQYLTPVEIEKIKNYKRPFQIRLEKIESLKAQEEKERREKQLERERMEKKWSDFQSRCIKAILENDYNFKDSVKLIRKNAEKWKHIPIFQNWLQTLRNINERNRWKDQLNAWQRDFTK